MKQKRIPAARLFRPAGPLLPLAFCIASLQGRSGPALALFMALYAARLCALSTADSLRAAFSCQPSINYVQGSALMALLLQLPGSLLAGLLMYWIPETRLLASLVPCGLLYNIEHVFYEYLYATGDRYSAMLCRFITAILTLVGLLLCAPPLYGLSTFATYETVWLLLASGLSALVGMVIATSSGGKLHPRLNAELFRHTPLAMVQTALCPALILTALALLCPGTFSPVPLFAGLALYEACRTPFRRSSQESVPMNRLLLIVGISALLGVIFSRQLSPGTLADGILMTCISMLIAALCAFGLYGHL